MGSGTRIERELSETGEGTELLLQLVIDVQCPLAGVGGLHGVLACKLLQGGEFFIDDRIVFHRAAAQRIETIVHTEVIMRKVRIMTYDGHFVAFGQGCLLGAQQIPGQFAEAVPKIVLWQGVTLASWS